MICSRCKRLGREPDPDDRPALVCLTCHKDTARDMGPAERKAAREWFAFGHLCTACREFYYKLGFTVYHGTEEAFPERLEYRVDLDARKAGFLV